MYHLIGGKLLASRGVSVCVHGDESAWAAVGLDISSPILVVDGEHIRTLIVIKGPGSLLLCQRLASPKRVGNTSRQASCFHLLACLLCHGLDLIERSRLGDFLGTRVWPNGRNNLPSSSAA